MTDESAATTNNTTSPAPAINVPTNSAQLREVAEDTPTFPAPPVVAEAEQPASKPGPSQALQDPAAQAEAPVQVQHTLHAKHCCDAFTAQELMVKVCMFERRVADRVSCSTLPTVNTVMSVWQTVSVALVHLWRSYVLCSLFFDVAAQAQV